jgi:ribosomal protein S3
MITQNLTTRFIRKNSKLITYGNHHLINTPAIESILNNAFATVNIIHGKAIIQQTTNKIQVTVPYYVTESNESITANLINIVSQQLSIQSNSPVQLQIVRLTSAYLDANVVAKFISREFESNRFRTVILNLFTHIGSIKPYTQLDLIYTGSIIGIKVQLSGRLIEESSLPRQTIQSASIGSFRSNNLHTIQSSSHTTTNIKGTYTVKV